MRTDPEFFHNNPLKTKKMGKVHAVRVLSAALDEVPNGTGKKKIILRGVIDPATLDGLLVDDYQREKLPIGRKNTILPALRKGEVLPDIEVGMRGDNFKIDEDAKGNAIVTLHGKVFIIDGLQRVTAARAFLQEKPEGVGTLRLGMVVHFNTTHDWEQERFKVLNLFRLPVSPNVILRNARNDSKAMEMLHNLTMNDDTFVLHERTSWAQRMTRKEIITVLGVVKAICYLHSHKAAARGTRVEDLVRGLDKIYDAVGVQKMKANIRTFFNLVDECFGIKRVQYKESALHMRGAFLKILARILSDHPDFWRGEDEKELFIDTSIKRKLAQFPMNDPGVIQLAGSTGKSQEMLYTMIVNHINRGKTSKRLKSRYSVLTLDSVPEEEEVVVES